MAKLANDPYIIIIKIKDSLLRSSVYHWSGFFAATKNVTIPAITLQNIPAPNPAYITVNTTQAAMDGTPKCITNQIANTTNNIIPIINIASFFILYEIYILYPTKTGLKITGIWDEKYTKNTRKMLRKCCSDWVLYMRSATLSESIPGVFHEVRLSCTIKH